MFGILCARPLSTLLVPLAQTVHRPAMAAPPNSPYPPAIVAWARDNTHRGALAHDAYPAILTGSAINRSCGDRLTIQLGCRPERENFVVQAARFEGEGCALCMAAAAALCGALDGVTLDGAAGQLASFRAVLQAETAPDEPVLVEGLGAFVAVAPFPARHRCVTLCAEAAQAALDSLSPTR